MWLFFWISFHLHIHAYEQNNYGAIKFSVYKRQNRKEAINQRIKQIQKWSKEVKSDNFFYFKDRKVTIKWGTIEKKEAMSQLIKLYKNKAKVIKSDN